MEVKCPKCRFRYDTPVASGENEVACVCPRCGVPFTLSMTVKYKVQEGGEVPSNAAEKPLDAATDAPVSSAKSQQPPQESAPAQRREQSSSAYPPPFVPSINARSARNPYSVDRRSPSSHGCLRNCLLVFIVTFVVAVFIVRNCGLSRSYTQESFQGGNTGEMVSEEVEKSRGEKPPMWLEGTWRAETQQGVVVITIYGNRIVELIDGEESRGTFIYTRAKLYCNFGDGEPVVRRVDKKRRQLFFDDFPMVKQ